MGCVCPKKVVLGLCFLIRGACSLPSPKGISCSRLMLYPLAISKARSLTAILRNSIAAPPLHTQDTPPNLQATLEYTQHSWAPNCHHSPQCTPLGPTQALVHKGHITMSLIHGLLGRFDLATLLQLPHLICLFVTGIQCPAEMWMLCVCTRSGFEGDVSWLSCQQEPHHPRPREQGRV